MHINIYMLLKCACVLDFLKLASMRACSRICRYPLIAGKGMVSYSLRVAGTGAARILARGYGFMKLISARILPVEIFNYIWKPYENIQMLTTTYFPLPQPQ